MPRIARWVIVSGLLLAPFTAAAMSSTLWSFRGMATGDWSATPGLQTQVTGEGLHIKATQDGAMYRPSHFSHHVSTMRITAAAAHDMEMKLLWEEKGGSEKAMVELPFVLNAGLQTIDIDMSKFPQWNEDANAIGLAFPAGAEVMLQTVEFRGWNLIERMEEALLTTWTFDTFRAYSINFLWGPLIVTNPVARAQLFDSLPPFGASVNNYVYGLVALAGIAFWITKFRRLDAATQKKYFTLFLGTAASCWVLYDARMSAEILSYARSDFQEYVFAAPESRTFRQFQDFWKVIDAAAPELKGVQNVVFAGPAGAPFLSYARYSLYPTHVTSVDEQHSANAVWLVYQRPDAAVNTDGRLTLNGVTISEPGGVVRTITENSFLFRETP